MRSFRKALVMLFGGLFSLSCAAEFSPGDGQLPELSWEKRSDWVDVKDFGAKGDGKTDDAAALQAALDKADNGVTIFIPSGDYRITSTLVLSRPGPGQGETRIIGFSLIGAGRGSRLFWDGEPGGSIMLDDGVAYSRFVGFVLDGMNKAAVGFRHRSMVGFETEVDYQHCGFLNCAEAGIKADPDDNFALAEVTFDNCLFQNCGAGASFTQFNDYDFTFTGCEFRGCGKGVLSNHANFYIRDCGFFGSKEADVAGNYEHGSSIRRCVSVGSGAFAAVSGSVAPLTIESCRVMGWDAKRPAIAAPSCSLIFDCVFQDGRTAIRLPKGHSCVASNNQSCEVSVDSGAKWISVPNGRHNGLAGRLGVETRFLNSKAKISGKVFDAKIGFGAKGDGMADDTAAIQKAIDAARSHGAGAIAYLPIGRYVINDTLRISGKDYYVGGGGPRSALIWRGKPDGTMIEVESPLDVTLGNLAVGNHDSGRMNNGVDILQRGYGTPSRMIYDRVFVFGKSQKQPLRKGLRFEGLGKDDTVLLRQTQGNLRFIGCGAATILGNVTFEGSITVEGKGGERGGLLGFMTRLSTLTEYGLHIKDSHSLVASDYYYEQAPCGFKVEGSPGDPPGKVVVSSGKAGFSD